MLFQLKLVGGLLVALALVHAVFPRYFDWRRDLAPLQLINREMMVVHTFFVALMVLLMGLLCLTSAPELLGTALGRRVCGGLAAFWTVRLLTQFFGYSSELWRGKPFETAVHVAFTALWVYLSGLFWVAAGLNFNP